MLTEDHVVEALNLYETYLQQERGPDSYYWEDMLWLSDQAPIEAIELGLKLWHFPPPPLPEVIQVTDEEILIEFDKVVSRYEGLEQAYGIVDEKIKAVKALNYASASILREKEVKLTSVPNHSDLITTINALKSLRSLLTGKKGETE